MRCLLAAVVLASCSHGGQENLGLPAEPPVTVDVTKLATVGELLHALALPGGQLDQLLGAHRSEARSSLKVEPPGLPVEKLEELYRLDSDGKGAVHLTHENTRDGLEVVVAGATVYARPRFGHWSKRRPEPDEVERLRQNVEGVAAAYVELLSRWLAVKELGRTEVNGRPAVRLGVSAVASPTSASAETLAYRKWRDTVKVRHANGEWLVDAASGAPLSGKLEASYTFEGSDLKGPTTVTLEYEQHGGPPEPIVAPADAVEPRRARPLVDRDQLLDGLAPPRANH